MSTGKKFLFLGIALALTVGAVIIAQSSRQEAPQETATVPVQNAEPAQPAVEAQPAPAEETPSGGTASPTTEPVLEPATETPQTPN
jgi:hypothetical protein